jgi:outer membrane lipoprotein carrier protein
MYLALAGGPAGASAARPAQPPLDLGVVVGRMQKRYEQAVDFKAKFSQSLTNPTFGRNNVSTGELLVKKPGRMRWNYEKPEKKMYLSTGQVLWMYEPDEKQAVKQDLKGSQLPAAVSFLMGKGKLTDEFEISFAKDIPFGTPTEYRLQLRPRQPQSMYKSIYFVVDPESFLVKQSVLIDAQGLVNAITFFDTVVNSKIPDATFKWSPPAGVRVIDPTAQPK